jgi:hypothetical protein
LTCACPITEVNREAQARLEAEKAATLLAAEEAERAAAIAAEKKAERDARYAARKAALLVSALRPITAATSCDCHVRFGPIADMVGRPSPRS